MERVTQVFSSDLDELPAMRAFVRQACHRAWGSETDEKQIALLELALDEAAANVIRHGYEGRKGRPIELTVETSSEQVRVSLSHEGRDFDPASVPPPCFNGTREGGFGLYLIKQVVDKVQYFHDGRGRCGVRLVKRRR